jgi:hypothetical protein
MSKHVVLQITYITIIFTYTTKYFVQIMKPICLHTYLPMKIQQTECSETSAYKIQTPGNYPEENIQRSQHGESLKSRTNMCV